MFIIKVIFKSDSSMLCVNLTLLYPNTFLGSKKNQHIANIVFYFDPQSVVIFQVMIILVLQQIVFAIKIIYESAYGFVA